MRVCVVASLQASCLIQGLSGVAAGILPQQKKGKHCKVELKSDCSSFKIMTMPKFTQKKGNDNPAISTASLPDIIFMLLFFFMVVTVMRDSNLKVNVTTPNATELTKLEKKSLVNYVYIGRPTENYMNQYGTRPRVQLGDKFADVSDIPLFLANHRKNVPESQRGLIKSSLRIDKDVTMGIVTEVKTSLRKAGQLAVNYSAKPRT